MICLRFGNVSIDPVLVQSVRCRDVDGVQGLIEVLISGTWVVIERKPSKDLQRRFEEILEEISAFWFVRGKND